MEGRRGWTGWLGAVGCATGGEGSCIFITYVCDLVVMIGFVWYNINTFNNLIANLGATSPPPHGRWTDPASGKRQPLSVSLALPVLSFCADGQERSFNRQASPETKLALRDFIAVVHCLCRHRLLV